MDEFCGGTFWVSMNAFNSLPLPVCTYMYARELENATVILFPIDSCDFLLFLLFLFVVVVVGGGGGGGGGSIFELEMIISVHRIYHFYWIIHGLS